MDDIRQQISTLQARISRDEAVLIALEQDVRGLQDELTRFKQLYDQLVQPVVDRLKVVRAAITDLQRQIQGPPIWQMPDLQQAHTFQLGPQGVTLDAPEIPTPAPDPQAESLKALYRRLARQYHPDHTTDAAEAAYRTRVMAHINAAYAARDLDTLQVLASQAHIPDPDEPLDVLLLRELHNRHLAIREQIQHLKQQHFALMHCDLMRLKTETSLNRQKGRDLLREIAAQLETDYRGALRELYDLRRHAGDPGA
ncbi:MAG: hypothetical protein ACLFTK_12835 [Anaerolineales bacterium]